MLQNLILSFEILLMFPDCNYDCEVSGNKRGANPKIAIFKMVSPKSSEITTSDRDDIARNYHLYIPSSESELFFENTTSK